MPRKIAIAIDGSEQSAHAFNWAADNVVKPDDTIVFIHGREDPVANLIAYSGMSGGVVGSPELFQNVEAHSISASKTMVEKYTHVAENRKLTHIEIEGKGDPKDIIVEAVKECNADLLVIGSRGLGAIKRAFVGSVSSHCVHHCHCPVLVVRND
eukprot:JP437839.1.p1 GENE.JP437839.1~~JP437839.1.p1  ORF type:complete len:154 (-),score=65.23 JP437839.1:44-505(-)